MATIIVEREFKDPIDLQVLEGTIAKGKGCRSLHNVTYTRAYMSEDKRQMFCVFDAPDMEAVRNVNRTAGIPYTKMWVANVLTFPEDDA